MPLPLAPPKLPTQPILPDTDTITATTISPNSHLLPYLGDIHPGWMLQLRSEYEGNFSFTRVLPNDLQMWKSENPELIENDGFRYEYNFLDERFTIKCMHTPTHDSLQCFFNQNLVTSLAGKVGSSRAMGLVRVGSGTSMLWKKSAV